MSCSRTIVAKSLRCQASLRPTGACSWLSHMRHICVPTAQWVHSGLQQTCRVYALRPSSIHTQRSRTTAGPKLYRVVSFRVVSCPAAKRVGVRLALMAAAQLACSSVFVTWKKAAGGRGEPRLRGCIGTLDPRDAHGAVKDYALIR